MLTGRLLKISQSIRIIPPLKFFKGAFHVLEFLGFAQGFELGLTQESKRLGSALLREPIAFRSPFGFIGHSSQVFSGGFTRVKSAYSEMRVALERLQRVGTRASSSRR